MTSPCLFSLCFSSFCACLLSIHLTLLILTKSNYHSFVLLLSYQSSILINFILFFFLLFPCFFVSQSVCPYFVESKSNSSLSSTVCIKDIAFLLPIIVKLVTFYLSRSHKWLFRSGREKENPWNEENDDDDVNTPEVDLCFLSSCLTILHRQLSNIAHTHIDMHILSIENHYTLSSVEREDT